MILQLRTRVTLRAFHGHSHHNISNHYSFTRFFSLSKPGNTNKKEPLSEEENFLLERKKKEERKEYDRNYHQKNKEKRNEASRKYDENHRDEIREASRQAYEKNKEKNKAAKLAKKLMDPNYVHIPRNNWKDKDSVKSFFDGKIREVFRIEKLSDWYNVSIAQVRKNGGAGAIFRHKSLGFALKFAYPDYAWNMRRFQQRSKTSAQRWLLLKLKGLLPVGIVPHYNFRKDPALKLKGYKYPSQYDIFIKEFRLALEYQGEQHYTDDIKIPSRNSLSERQKKDNAKLDSSIEHGTTLVYIPHWWDMKSDSLSSTLNQYFPNIFPKTSSPPIPTELPADYSKYKKPGLRTNKNIMKGSDYEQYENEINVEGWFMSEKLDGIRAYWDGQNFLSKNNNIINVPEFLKQLPPFPVDGELWNGYQDNQSLLSFLKQSCGVVTKRNKDKLDWAKIKFCVFDAPNVEGSYDKRHFFLENNFTQYCNSIISLIPMQKCNGKEHLKNHLEEIVKKGGEGIMIYNPVSHYQPGRSKNVLKVKKYYESEIKFLERSEVGYHFKCLQNNGSEVLLKVTGGYHERTPEVGSMIPVKHQGFFANSQNFKYPVLYEPESSKPQKQPKKQTKKQTKKQPNVTNRD
jgi:DNA ligase-1